MTQTNFLIGRGELLTHNIEIRKGGTAKKDAYTIAEARQTLTHQLNETIRAFAKMPEVACPQGMVVARMTLHPEYIAKSYFPSGMLRLASLRSVGSKTVTITPRKWTRKGSPRELSTTDVFVAGRRRHFEDLLRWVNSVQENDAASKEILRIEIFRDFAAVDRVKGIERKSQRYFEVGVHLLANENSNFIQTAFREFAASLGIQMHERLSLTAGSLWFVPVEGNQAAIHMLAQFAFIRVIRPIPPLRRLRPVGRSSPITVSSQLTNEMPLSNEPRVAILDGGLPKITPLKSQWINSYKVSDSNAKDDAEGLAHGLAVTSAFLFGPLIPGGIAPRPFSPVDHVRVLDSNAQNEDPYQLYRTLGHIEEVLLSRQYNFINLSLGPELEVDDDDVHAWTSVIDDLLSDGDTLMTIAAGNNGERDSELGLNRVQVPADCVNAIAVGSASDTANDWTRARYSAIGPGRRPGVVKPDLIAFGGDASGKYFHALHSNKQPQLVLSKEPVLQPPIC
jgi:hypothetical protein